jgi:DNA modification methylase
MQPNIYDQEVNDKFGIYNGDCVEFAKTLPDNSIDFCIYSPPYANLYIYGESAADMGNCADQDEFFKQYQFIVNETFRALRPGRLVAIHVKDLVYYQGSSETGTAGIRAFSDRCTDAHIKAGFDFHCRITIFRDPVLERAKTNAHGLLWKSFQSDATICRVGMPEYLMVYRKWAKEGEDDLIKPVTHPKSEVPLDIWQELASPIWNWKPGQSGKGDYDLPATDVLNARVAADPDAEKHLCPMPLNITKRALTLWTNEGDVVFSPFAGIGSEGVASLRIGRKFVGTELNPVYFRQAVKFLTEAGNMGQQIDLFDFMHDAA